MVYQPEEDSYLLQKFVEELAFGRVLDMGTGSGIQAEAAAKKKEVIEVVAVDINKEAVNQLKNKKLPKTKVIESDLFSKVSGRFDTVIFNPPYLPDDENDPDAAIDGGKQGYELVEKFLNQAKNHLNENAVVLLLFSNRTGRDEVNALLRREGYEFQLIGSQQLPFFEELYVYNIRLKSESEVFNKGKRGVIYKKKNVCIKEMNPDSSVNSIKNEAEFLQILNKKSIGPHFIKFEDNKLHREFIEGDGLEQFLNNAGKEQVLGVFLQVLKQCREMDLLGVNKQELTNPYKDIIVTPDNHAVMIDFERCRFTENPKNITQFLQFIAKKKDLLEKKGFFIDKQLLIELGKEYKENPSGKTFGSIIKAFTLM